MHIFSRCSGECCVCSYGGHCLASSTDDNFNLATKEQIINRIEAGNYASSKEYMVATLKDKFGYDYHPKKG